MGLFAGVVKSGWTRALESLSSDTSHFPSQGEADCSVEEDSRALVPPILKNEVRSLMPGLLCFASTNPKILRTKSAGFAGWKVVLP